MGNQPEGLGSEAPILICKIVRVSHWRQTPDQDLVTWICQLGFPCGTTIIARRCIDHRYLLNNLGSGGGKVHGGSLFGTLTDQVGQCGDGTSA
jgi:hypothetical protein